MDCQWALTFVYDPTVLYVGFRWGKIFLELLLLVDDDLLALLPGMSDTATKYK
jgi:hypothetical protein